MKYSCIHPVSAVLLQCCCSVQGLSLLASSPGPLRGGERPWYTLNVHAPTFSVKFAVKLIRYFCQHVAKYTEKLCGLRIWSSLER